MWRPVVVTVAAADEPLSLEDAIAHCRAPEDGTDDAYLAGCIAAARAHIEARTCTKLYTQTVSLKTDDWSDLESLPVAPVQSISSISYTDVDGNVQTLSTSVYEARLYLLEPTIVLKYGQTWPAIRYGSLITVTAVVGYGVAGAQPSDLMHAFKLIVADMYLHRETTAEAATVSVPIAANVDDLLCNHAKHLI